ncbi:acyl-CoA dehydrogenase family protein [Nocardia alni]|uniref:acyl-CoA dehydrogenase family protein n=1 Tax=Nocardia alni TaxID=2815723 RepID=UPI001C2493DF|nr:acyl-CoA dehydrogenase family protein [Nocardia alni]
MSVDQHEAARSSVTQRIAQLAGAAAALRRELPHSAAEVDSENTDTEFGMRRIWEEGLFAFNLPHRFGGISDARATQHTEEFFKILMDIASGDSAAGMNYGVQTLVTLEIFAEDNGLPESTKAELARLIRDEGVRLCASNAETGAGGPVTGRLVDGGLVVTGTKTFNTNSGSGGWANVGLAVEGAEGRYHALVPLDQPSVTMKHDWDVMGQRGTHSQSIVYDDVFVPDGYFYRGAGPEGALLPYVFLLHAIILLGPGLGAFDASLDYVRKLDRASLPEFASAGEDPLIRRRIGEFAVDLDCARAFLLRSAGNLEGLRPGESATELFTQAIAVKVACVRAALNVTQGIFDLTGARSTSNKYRFDRFWRNARTFATHDSTDAKEVWLGDWYLSGKEPPMAAMLRV